MSTIKGQVFHVETYEEFEQIMFNSKKYNIPVYLKFGAKWCSPCKKIQPLYETLAGGYPDCIFVCIDVDELDSIAETYSVSSLPTFGRVVKGNYTQLFTGANEQKLVRTIQSDNPAC